MPSKTDYEIPYRKLLKLQHAGDPHSEDISHNGDVPLKEFLTGFKYGKRRPTTAELMPDTTPLAECSHCHCLFDATGVTDDAILCDPCAESEYHRYFGFVEDEPYDIEVDYEPWPDDIDDMFVDPQLKLIWEVLDELDVDYDDLPEIDDDPFLADYCEYCGFRHLSGSCFSTKRRYLDLID